MYKDIRLHGCLDNQIEYYAIAAGRDAYSRYFFTSEQGGDGELRFFSAGSEFIIGSDGITHRGNGGSFCEYMFGVDQPLADLAKGDVINRLVMYGAWYDEQSGTLRFSDRTESFLSYEKIFFDGNAVCNYFFFVNSVQVGGSPQHQQETIVKLLGKAIKRSGSVGQKDDNAIIAELFQILQQLVFPNSIGKIDVHISFARPICAAELAGEKIMLAVIRLARQHLQEHIQYYRLL